MSIWILLFIILLIIELATINLVTIWFAIGAVIAYICSFFVDSYSIQMFIFVISSIITLLLTKPVVKKIKKGICDDKDIIIGRVGEVVESIDDLGNGRVVIDGISWKATSDESIKKGCKIVVKDITGVKLLVERRRD